MVKENENSKKILNPRLSIKLSPSHTKDVRNKNVKIDINNIYSVNRISDPRYYRRWFISYLWK
jgi:hypothetical protein